MTDQQEKKATDYTGVIIGIILLPVVLLSIRLHQESLGRSLCISLAALMIAIRVRWDLRHHVWFWGIIVLWLVLHIPLFLLIQWPHGWVPAIVMAPVAVVDCLIFLGVVQLIEKLTKSGSSV
jgi:Ca2+/Na+ antiporter